MSGPARIRRVETPPEESSSVIVQRLVASVDALTHSINEPKHGFKDKMSALETRMGQVEGKVDLVTTAFRLGGDDEGASKRRILGMTPIQLVFGLLGSAMGAIATIQVLAPPIAAFCRALAHSIMSHAVAAG